MANNEWNELQKWMAELVQQAKANAKRWFLIWIITFTALIGSNAAWLYVYLAK